MGQAIFKFLKETQSFGVNDKRVLLNVNNALKKGLEKGVFKMAKEEGKGSGSYKLGDKGLDMLKKANARTKPKPKKDVKKKETTMKATSKAKSKEDVGAPVLKKSASLKSKEKASARRRSSVGAPIKVKKAKQAASASKKKA